MYSFHFKILFFWLLLMGTGKEAQQVKSADSIAKSAGFLATQPLWQKMLSQWQKSIDILIDNNCWLIGKITQSLVELLVQWQKVLTH
jgi:hypothetical protein